jgi:hypothetical protein
LVKLSAATLTSTWLGTSASALCGGFVAVLALVTLRLYLAQDVVDRA